MPKLAESEVNNMILTNKEELIKELNEMYDFMNKSDEEIITKYPYLKQDDVDAFIIGYIRSNIKYIISDLKEWK